MSLIIRIKEIVVMITIKIMIIYKIDLPAADPPAPAAP